MAPSEFTGSTTSWNKRLDAFGQENPICLLATPEYLEVKFNPGSDVIEADHEAKGQGQLMMAVEQRNPEIIHCKVHYRFRLPGSDKKVS